MGDQKSRISRENVCTTTNRNGQYPITPCGRVKPPVVSKVDGRARILRPLRQPMQPNQQPTTSTSGTGRGSMRMNHSQSMPVLQQAAGNNSGSQPTQSQAQQGQQSQPTSRTALTLPSNTTERHVIPLLQWVEAMRGKLEKMRQKSRKALDDSLKEHSTLADLSRMREALTEMSNIYYDMNRAALLKCRYNAIFDKRELYKSLEFSMQELKMKDINSYVLFDKMQEAMDEKTIIEKNVQAMTDNFRLHAVVPSRISRFSAPPPITFGKHVEDANKGVWKAMEAVMNKVRGDPMTWKFRRISHPFFRNSKCLIEVRYCARRPAGEKEFVPYMKAMIVLKYGILEDLVIGGEDEELFDQERILHSKRIVYNEFTKSAKEIILCSPVTKFTTPANFAQCNNYIQSYVNCFSTKCYYCRKYLHQFLPPTVVTREASPIICHKVCLMSQVA